MVSLAVSVLNLWVSSISLWWFRCACFLFFMLSCMVDWIMKLCELVSLQNIHSQSCMVCFHVLFVMRRSHCAYFVWSNDAVIPSWYCAPPCWVMLWNHLPFCPFKSQPFLVGSQKREPSRALKVLFTIFRPLPPDPPPQKTGVALEAPYKALKGLIRPLRALMRALQCLVKPFRAL